MRKPVLTVLVAAMAAVLPLSLLPDRPRLRLRQLGASRRTRRTYQEYVALGDSWSADVVIADTDGLPDTTYAPTGCAQSHRNYPKLLAAALKVPDLPRRHLRLGHHRRLLRPADRAADGGDQPRPVRPADPDHRPGHRRHRRQRRRLRRCGDGLPQPDSAGRALQGEVHRRRHRPARAADQRLRAEAGRGAEEIHRALTERADPDGRLPRRHPARPAATRWCR